MRRMFFFHILIKIDVMFAVTTAVPAFVRRCLRPLAACTQLSELHLQGNPLAKDVTLRSLFPSLAPCLERYGESQA